MSTLTIQERFSLDATPEEVWSFLIDPSKVVTCLPGAELTGQKDENTYEGAVKVKVGAITMSYKGTAVFEETDKWFLPVGIAGFAMYVVGWISMAWAVRRSHVLARRATWALMVATLLMLVGLAIPTTGGAYLFAIGMMGFTWPLAYQALRGTGRISLQPSEE